MLADVAILSFKDLSAALWTFAQRLLPGEIDFRYWFFGLSLFFCLWLSFFEFETDVFLVGKHEERLERPPFAGNKAWEQISFANAEQFFQLLVVNWLLQNNLSRSEIAFPVGTDGIFADVAHSKLKDSPPALGTISKWLLPRKIYRLASAVLLPIWAEIKFSLEIVAQFKHRGKTRALSASKATQWPDVFITDESLEFFATKQSPGNR